MSGKSVLNGQTFLFNGMRLKMELLKINTGIYRINTWIVKLDDRNVFVVDPATSAFTGDENAVVSFLKANNLNPLGIILTHCHYDHVTGTATLKKAFPDVKICVHQADEVFCTQNAFETQGELLEGMGLGEFSVALKNLPAADVSLRGGETLDLVLGKDSSDEVKALLSQWKIIHTPGHTKGGVCIYSEKDKTLISGDTVFYMSYGRTDLPGGSDSEMIKTLKMIYSSLPGDTKVYPGHEHYGFTLKENMS